MKAQSAALIVIVAWLSLGSVSAQDCLFYDDFEAGNGGLWKLSDPDVVRFEDGMMRLEIAGPEAVTAWGILDPCVYGDFELSVDARSLAPTAAKIVVFHVSGPTSDFDGYGVNVRSDPWDDIVLIRRRAPFVNTVLAQVPYDSESDTWYRITVRMEGSRIQVSVDGVLIIDLVDGDPILEGWMSLAVNAGGLGLAQVDFDNFAIAPLTQAIDSERRSWGLVKSLYGAE